MTQLELARAQAMLDLDLAHAQAIHVSAAKERREREALHAALRELRYRADRWAGDRELLRSLNAANYRERVRDL